MKRMLSLFLVVVIMFCSFCIVSFASVNAANKATPEKVENLRITTANKIKMLNLTWDKQLKADGYQIYRSTSGKSGSYKKISTLRSPDKNSYTDTGLKNAKTYYYAVRAFCRIGGKEYFGKFAKASLSTRLTKSYLQKRLVAANKFYIDWIQHRFEAHACEDPSDTRPVPGDNYGFIYIHVKSDKYKSVADLKKEAAKYFTKPVYDELIENAYADFDGKLYRKSYDTGGDGGTDYGIMKIVSLKDTSCRIKVTGYFSDGEHEHSFTDFYNLVYKDGRWLFKNMIDEFGIYFLGNEYWK